MIVLVVHVRDIRSFEAKRDPPIATHLHGLSSTAISLKRVETKTRKSHVPRDGRHAQAAEDQSQARGMTGLNPRRSASSEEALQAFVPEPDNRHVLV